MSVKVLCVGKDTVRVSLGVFYVQEFSLIMSETISLCFFSDENDSSINVEYSFPLDSPQKTHQTLFKRVSVLYNLMLLVVIVRFRNIFCINPTLELEKWNRGIGDVKTIIGALPNDEDNKYLSSSST